MRILILSITICFSSVSFLFGESPAVLLGLSQEEYPLQYNLYWDEEVNPDLRLLPDVPGAEALRRRYADFKPEITIEKLYRLSGTQSYDEDASVTFTKLVNAFGQPGSQLGYTYHSATRDKDIELFEECYISDSKGREIDNFSFARENLPDTFTYYQYVDEANFSGTVLQQTIEITEDFFSNRSVNQKSLWFMFFPVMGKEELRSETFIFFHQGDLYIYTCSQVEKEPAAKKIGVPLHLPSMFGKRMDVMAQWLADQLQING